MGKGDDSIRRRMNKKGRRKQENKDSSSKVSTRIASIIAAKKRRQSGKRRNCQGMCFSLPTPEDPFNDRHGKIDSEKKRKRPNHSKTDRKRSDKNNDRLRKGSLVNNDADVGHQNQQIMKSENVENESILVSAVNCTRQDNVINLGKQMVQLIDGGGPKHAGSTLGFENSIERPSKFLIMCLNSIQSALCPSENINSEDKPLFANAWGVEFWNCYSSGKNVLDTSGAVSTIEQIAWIASTCADTISRKEKEGMSFTGPFLLFLVPSKEKASKVRQVCKPLKTLGIHTVSLHPGASIDHQIHGLKSCEPEFLVSTPQRLLELVSIKAVDISGVSLLAIDGLEEPCEGGYFDSIKSIRQLISGDPQTVIFSDCMNNSSIFVVQKLIGGSVYRSSISTFIDGQNACIMPVNMSKE